MHETATEIVPGLWIGTDFSCKSARDEGAQTICLLEEPCANEGCYHQPICETTPLGVVLVARPKKIAKAVKWIADRLDYRAGVGDKPRKVLVHCAAGIERSPLVVVTYLSQRYDISMDRAYEVIRARRPIVQDRRAWVSNT